MRVVGSASGQGLFIQAPSNGSLIVNGTEAEVADIFASNGMSRYTSMNRSGVTDPTRCRAYHAESPCPRRL